MQRLDVAVPDTADPSVGLLLGLLDATSAKWRGELAGLDDEALWWQPFPGGHSIGMILLHCADAEGFWLHQVAGGLERNPDELKTLLSEETDQFGVLWPDCPQRPLGWFLNQQAAVRKRTHEIVGDLLPLDMVGMNHGREFTLRWILHHVIAHEAYHYGQAVLLSLLYDRRNRIK